MHSQRKVSAFKSAVELEVVGAEVDVDDVLQINPSMSREDAVKFLRDHANVIGTAMIEAGVAATIALISGGQHGN